MSTQSNEKGLRDAASNGQINEVKMYLNDTTVDVNGKDDNDKWTALHCACHRGHCHVAELLLDHGADIEAAVLSNIMPYTFLRGHSDIPVEHLFDHRADIEPVVISKITPLILACAFSCSTITRLLLARGAEVNGPVDNDGNSPLHNACWRGSSKCVEMLLDHGADTTTKNKFGHTALDVAREEKYQYIINLILRTRMDNQIDSKETSTQCNGSCIEIPLEERQLPEKVESTIDHNFEKIRHDIKARQRNKVNKTVQILTTHLESKVETIVARHCEEMKNDLFASNEEEIKQSFEVLTVELVSTFNSIFTESVLNLSTTVENLSSKISTIQAFLDSNGEDTFE